MGRIMRHKSTWMMTLIAMLVTGSLAWAGDHDRVRSLLEQGEILSLSEIMQQNSKKFSGKVLEVELEEKDGLIVYDMEFLGENGVVMEMQIDARTGRVISVEED
ncbi:MAG: PepSY domain-containing protein [Mariprofundaceae bacterium]|nr:PepSY domain-containing protein [Mariprofundaceae bacterium]